jgi:hypothetical protein
MLRAIITYGDGVVAAWYQHIFLPKKLKKLLTEAVRRKDWAKGMILQSLYIKTATT